MPIEGSREITCGLDVLGDQRRVLISRGRVTRFDGRREPTVQFGAVGLQL